MYFVRLISASLGLAGWITYTFLWGLARVYGSIELNLDWFPRFEENVEPFILVGIITFMTWMVIHHMRRV